MKASAYCGLVGVDIAASERDCAMVDLDATSPLTRLQKVGFKPKIYYTRLEPTFCIGPS